MLKKWLIKVSTLIKKMFDLFINLMRSGGKWVFQSSLEYITTRPKQRQYSIAFNSFTTSTKCIQHSSGSKNYFMDGEVSIMLWMSRLW